MMTVLVGHDSQETARIDNDYPYGFRLRCIRRSWLEYKKGFGYRLMTQTTNPKRSGEVWNKVKGSTYSALMVMALDDQGHLFQDGLHVYANEEKINTFCTRYADALQGEREQKILTYLRACDRAQKRVKVTVRVVHEGDVPGQTLEEQQGLMRALVSDELVQGTTH